MTIVNLVGGGGTTSLDNSIPLKYDYNQNQGFNYKSNTLMSEEYYTALPISGTVRGLTASRTLSAATVPYLLRVLYRDTANVVNQIAISAPSDMQQIYMDGTNNYMISQSSATKSPTVYSFDASGGYSESDTFPTNTMVIIDPTTVLRYEDGSWFKSVKEEGSWVDGASFEFTTSPYGTYYIQNNVVFRYRDYLKLSDMSHGTTLYNSRYAYGNDVYSMDNMGKLEKNGTYLATVQRNTSDYTSIIACDGQSVLYFALASSSGATNKYVRIFDCSTGDYADIIPLSSKLTGGSSQVVTNGEISFNPNSYTVWYMDNVEPDPDTRNFWNVQLNGIGYYRKSL